METAMAPALLFAGLTGLAIGSFLGVVAHRLPRGGSIVRPRSACPACGNAISARDNVPVVSWLVLRGRCRSCSASIHARYPLTEAAVGLGFVAVAIRFEGDGAAIALGWLLVATLAAITVTDLERRIIPNRILAASALAWLAIAVPFAGGELVEGIVAALVAGGFLGAIALAYPSGMGMGDAKLCGLIGLYLGASAAVALLVALLAGSLAGGILIARHGQGARKRAIPFGPFLALGGLVGLFAGPEIIEWYRTTFLGG